MRYITETGGQNAKRYRYSGSDNSLVYRLLCSPLAEELVARLVPVWVAPNLITCLGLMPSVLGHGLVWYHCGDLRARCPRWCWATVGVCTFLYQTLDNMDGKQARRTGTSSPLGLLLDHGADALNIVLSALNVMAMLQLGDSPGKCMLVWLASATPFYFATWEEFYTGSLYLGFFNGPTDGVLILCSSQLLSAYVEDYTAFWNAESLVGVSRKAAVIAFYLFCVCATVLANFAAVVRINRTWPRVRAALLLALPFCLSLAAGAAVLASASGAEAFARQPRLIFWLMGLVFLKLVVHLQLAHICGEAYRPWRQSLLPPALLVACSILAPGLVGRALPPGAAAGWAPGVGLAALRFAAGLLAASCLHLALGATRELAQVLGLRVFVISAGAPAKSS